MQSNTDQNTEPNKGGTKPPLENHEGSSLSSLNERKKGGILSRVSIGKCALFIGVALIWFALDMATKAYANSFERGEVFAGPFAGLFQFRLAHNTGAAWSMFSGSTFALAILALVVLVVLVAIVALFSWRITWLEAFSLGLVFAGGIGNALDRFTLGYVVDFIQTLFISFPTFNVADIGVTCGVLIFALSFVLRTFSQKS